MRVVVLLSFILVACGSGSEVQVLHDASGSLRGRVERRGGERHGEALLLHGDGGVHKQGRYVRDRKEGAWETFDAAGRRVEEVHYRNGLMHGVYRRIDARGALLMEVHYEGGRMHGAVVENDAEGRPVRRAHYAHGLLHGPYQGWEREDTLQRGSRVEGWYVRGEAMGVWARYYGDGTKALEGTRHKGVRDGSWRFWDRDGSLRGEVEYRNGKELRRSGRPDGSAAPVH